MATVTKAYDPDTLTLEQALEIIETKLSKGGKPKPEPKAKAIKEKPVKKKAPAKKAVAKKTATKTTKAKKK